MRDDWLCCKDVIERFVTGFSLEDKFFRVFETRDTAIEHFFSQSFALPSNMLQGFLAQPTLEAEQDFENKRGRIKLINPNNNFFICRQFAKHFQLRFAGGTCRDGSTSLVAHHYKADKSNEEYIEADVNHLEQFLADTSHVLMFGASVLRYSERHCEEYNFSDLRLEEADETYRFNMKVESGSRKFRMNTTVRLVGKCIVNLNARR